MVFCGMSFCGEKHSLDTTPTDTNSIKKIKICNGVYDSLFASINTYLDWDGRKNYDWDFYTLLFADFKNTLLAGNVDFLVENINSIKIKRKRQEDNVYQTVFEIPISKNEDFNFQKYDYMAAGNQIYDYALVPCLNNAEGTYSVNQIKCEFEGVFLIEKDISYQAILNTSLSHNRVRAGTSVTTLGRRTPFHISNGLSNYTAGSLSATYIPKDAKGHYLPDIGWKFRENFNDFLVNGRPKILKTFEGKIWLIHVLENTISETEKDHYQNIITSFDWEETGDANNQTDLYNAGIIDVPANRW